MELRAPSVDFLTPFEDSRRWAQVSRRPGDIVVATPPKSGTTWMQAIVVSLLWPDGDAPGTVFEVSPWIDVRVTPVDELTATIEAQQHRRCFKTHSPADAVPIDPAVTYVAVYRDGLDSLVSWGNHRAKMRPEIVDWANASAALDGVAPIPPTFAGDYDELYVEWSEYFSPVRHLPSWWQLRNEPNVHLFHYADLWRDLEGGMRRLARILEIDIADGRWPGVVARCRLDEMRAEAAALGRLNGFIGGAESFFYKGGNGRGAELLPPQVIERYRAAVVAELEPAAAAWLKHGSAEQSAKVHKDQT